MVYKWYILPIGGLYATDPTFQGNQKQPLNQSLGGSCFFRPPGPRYLGMLPICRDFPLCERWGRRQCGFSGVVQMDRTEFCWTRLEDFCRGIFQSKSFLFPWLDICCIQRLVCWFAYQIGAEHKSWSMYFHCHCWEICFTHLQGGPSWIYVLGSRIPLFPYNRGWSSTQ